MDRVNGMTVVPVRREEDARELMRIVAGEMVLTGKGVFTGAFLGSPRVVPVNTCYMTAVRENCREAAYQQLHGNPTVGEILESPAAWWVFSWAHVLVVTGPGNWHMEEGGAGLPALCAFSSLAKTMKNVPTGSLAEKLQGLSLELPVEFATDHTVGMERPLEGYPITPQGAKLATRIATLAGVMEQGEVFRATMVPGVPDNIAKFAGILVRSGKNDFDRSYINDVSTLGGHVVGTYLAAVGLVAHEPGSQYDRDIAPLLAWLRDPGGAVGGEVQVGLRMNESVALQALGDAYVPCVVTQVLPLDFVHSIVGAVARYVSFARGLDFVEAMYVNADLRGRVAPHIRAEMNRVAAAIRELRGVPVEPRELMVVLDGVDLAVDVSQEIRDVYFQCVRMWNGAASRMQDRMAFAGLTAINYFVSSVSMDNGARLARAYVYVTPAVRACLSGIYVRYGLSAWAVGSGNIPELLAAGFMGAVLLSYGMGPFVMVAEYAGRDWTALTFEEVSMPLIGA